MVLPQIHDCCWLGTIHWRPVADSLPLWQIQSRAKHPRVTNFSAWARCHYFRAWYTLRKWLCPYHNYGTFRKNLAKFVQSHSVNVLTSHCEWKTNFQKSSSSDVSQHLSTSWESRVSVNVSLVEQGAQADWRCKITWDVQTTQCLALEDWCPAS